MGQKQMWDQSPPWSYQLKLEAAHQNGIRPHGPNLAFS